MDVVWLTRGAPWISSLVFLMFSLSGGYAISSCCVLVVTAMSFVLLEVQLSAEACLFFLYHEFLDSFLFMSPNLYQMSISFLRHELVLWVVCLKLLI